MKLDVGSPLVMTSALLICWDMQNTAVAKSNLVAHKMDIQLDMLALAR
jgi:hypothetical protein